MQAKKMIEKAVQRILDDPVDFRKLEFREIIDTDNDANIYIIPVDSKYCVSVFVPYSNFLVEEPSIQYYVEKIEPLSKKNWREWRPFQSTQAEVVLFRRLWNALLYCAVCNQVDPVNKSMSDSKEDLK